jgi:hypothetical protein
MPPMPKTKPNAIQTSTTFPPAASATLLVLAKREDGGRGAANGILTRLLREELERIRPGLWDRLLAEEEARVALRPNETALECQAWLAAWLKAELAGGGK